MANKNDKRNGDDPGGIHESDTRVVALVAFTLATGTIPVEENDIHKMNVTALATKTHGTNTDDTRSANC